VRTVLTVSDLQVPYHHPRAVKALAKFIADWRPDVVQCVGDELDAPQISRWSRGRRAEYVGQLHKHRDQAVRILEQLNVTHLSRSNHGEDRLRSYLGQYAPALYDEPELQYERYMRLPDLGITYHRSLFEFAPGWLLGHGDEGGLSGQAGTTGTKLARAVGKSVCIGHTHRAGIVPHTEAYGGKVTRTVYGMEVGCLMDMGKAGYLKSGGANWQLAVGLHYVEGKRVSPHLIYINPDGSFTWDKHVWSA
jgi:hypothetical protein